ncbi:MAG: aminoacyl-tRNA hydrolase [Patescibacteria group bacterium]
MFLIVGLGNFEPKYDGTRHNVGFAILDTMANNFRASSKHEAEVAKTKLADIQTILAKPTTFMNLSGRAVKSLAQFHKIPASNIIIVHDDADLPFGEMRMKFGGGSAGHKGVKSIIEELGTDRFWRLRFGIGRSENLEMSLDSFVLEPFTEAERSALETAIPEAARKIETHIASAFEQR